LESFKVADARFKRTGAGIHDFNEFRSFHDSVLKKHCRWYHELYPVFHDRPNVNAAYTNEDENDDSSSVGLEDDESLVSTSNSNSSDVEVVNFNNNVSNNESGKESTATNDNNNDFNLMNNMERHDTSLQKSNEHTSSKNDEASGNDESVQIVPVSPVPITPTNVESPKKKARLTPSQAKHIQKGLISNKKKQVRGKGRKGTGVFWNSKEEEEREVLMECRRTKMKFEQERHEDIKKIEHDKLQDLNKREAKKLSLDEERLKLESKAIEMKMKRESVLYSQERKNLMLLNMKIFKERQQMKKDDPTLTDEYLDKYFKLDME
jgi:hypothetical protein